MKCADFEILLALEVGGDLPGPQGGAVAEHLLVCPSCRRFADRLKFSQALLKDLGQEPLDEQMVQEVRRRVRNGIATKTPLQSAPVWRWVLEAGVIAALIFVSVVLRHYSPGARTRIVAERSTTANASVPARTNKNGTRNPTVDFRSAKPARAAKHLSANSRRSEKLGPGLLASSEARKSKRANEIPSSKFSSGSLRASANVHQPEPLTVKLLTDNPNVVIYWLID